MAYTYRNRRWAYDNIANGSAAGFENHKSAATSQSETTAPNRDSGGNSSTSALAVGRRENVVHNPTSSDTLVGMDTSTQAGWTSGTSSTSVQYETVA